MKLKPCPFCGGKAEIRKEVDTSFMDGVAFVAYKVVCSKCWASPLPNNYYGDKQEAIDLWNRREPIDKIVEQLEVKSERIADEVGEIYHSGKIFTEEGGRYFVERVFTEAIEIVKKGGAV